MHDLLAILAGILISVSVYLLLSLNIMRILFGIAILSSAVNLIIFTAGRLTHTVPVFITDSMTNNSKNMMANPLPQALILTAIVIGFGLLAYGLVLIRNYWQMFDTLNSHEVQAAEPQIVYYKQDANGHN